MVDATKKAINIIIKTPMCFFDGGVNRSSGSAAADDTADVEDKILTTKIVLIFAYFNCVTLYYNIISLICI